MCRDKGWTGLSKCARCFRAQSVIPLAYSGLLESGASAGSFCPLMRQRSVRWQPELFPPAQTGGNRCETGGSLPLFGSGGLLSAPCVSQEMVFQVICWGFTGISSPTAFLPRAWMLPGSPLTSPCGMSKQFGPWGIISCRVLYLVWEQLDGQRGLSPERSVPRVFSLWLNQCC